MTMWGASESQRLSRVMSCNWREAGFRPAWFSEAVPTLYYEPGLNLDPTDVVVVPEDLGILEHLKNAPLRKIVFCQNHFYAFSALRPGETWRGLGVTHVLSSSDVIAEFVRKNLGWSDAPVVHYASSITRLFKPAEKKLQIAYMPRKRSRSMPVSFAACWAAMGGRAAGRRSGGSR